MKNSRRIDISFNQAINMIKENNNIVIIDVKSNKEYNNFHLEKSINIPIENFKNIVVRKIKNKNQIIIVYCSSGVRSVVACEMLQDLGYYNVYNISGGVS